MSALPDNSIHPFIKSKFTFRKQWSRNINFHIKQSLFQLINLIRAGKPRLPRQPEGLACIFTDS